jgi:hypothetical protein
MDQYNQDAQQAVASAPMALGLQAQVLPHVVELKWDNKTLRVTNPEHVRQLSQLVDSQKLEIQQLKERHQQLHVQVQQLQRMVQQLTNTISG